MLFYFAKEEEKEMDAYIHGLANNSTIRILIISIVLDVFLGSLRAFKEKKWNSTVGINGMLRKFGMIGSVFFLGLADTCINLDLLFFVPQEIVNALNLQKIGSCELFSLMFILYEITSILKNMVLCDMPIPKGVKNKVEKLLTSMTSELESKK
jgi:toxin secretion/phage lysis holin